MFPKVTREGNKPANEPTNQPSNQPSNQLNNPFCHNFSTKSIEKDVHNNLFLFSTIYELCLLINKCPPPRGCLNTTTVSL